MIRPESQNSTIQQLHMGEGKSSVIVPLVATSLADGGSLARVVVLKPLASQMFNMLVQRLSGLARRRVYYLPFSRGIKLGSEQARIILESFLECMHTHGVLVAQPEHILSFRLTSTLQQIGSLPSTSSLDSIPSTIRLTYQWLTQHSRDVLDESDEILQVKYQLVYTLGFQQPVSDHPNRWLTTQQVLSLVRQHTPSVRQRFPNDIVVDKNDGSHFPRIKSLKGAAEDMLTSLVAEYALDGQLTTCPQLALLSTHHRSVALIFITIPAIPTVDREAVLSLKSHFGEDHAVWKTLLLLRGLLANRILSYAFDSRRYRVDYGLDPSRSLMAVPYRAKDVPSLRAEFGHPDVCIALTCLSYYYGDLSGEQVDQCFELLFHLDHRRQEYETWTYNIVDLPETLRTLDGVNLKDSAQRTTQLHPIFRRCDAVIDFFLSNVVFPRCVAVLYTYEHFYTGPV